MTDIAAESGRKLEPTINLVYRDRPWDWLKAGWRDLTAAPMASLPYGLVLAVIGMVLTWIVWVEEVYYLTFPLMAGFLLVGPIVAVGLYEVSRRLGEGESPTFGDAFGAFKRNPTQLALMGVVLLLVNIAWVRLASLIFLLFFSDRAPPVDVWGFLDRVVSPESLPFLIFGNLIGALIAAFVFAITAFSIPILADRPGAHVMEAMILSFKAVHKNAWTMALWAVLIVVFIGIGILTGFVGLIITLPLIGHATWAAYKEIITWPDETASASAA